MVRADAEQVRYDTTACLDDDGYQVNDPYVPNRRSDERCEFDVVLDGDGARRLRTLRSTGTSRSTSSSSAPGSRACRPRGSWSSAGVSVAVLEAGQVAASTTGFTTAKVSVLHTLRVRPHHEGTFGRDGSHGVRGVAAGRLGAGVRARRAARDRLRPRAPAVGHVRHEAPVAFVRSRLRRRPRARRGCGRPCSAPPGCRTAWRPRSRSRTRRSSTRASTCSALADAITDRGGLIFEDDPRRGLAPRCRTQDHHREGHTVTARRRRRRDPLPDLRPCAAVRSAACRRPTWSWPVRSTRRRPGRHVHHARDEDHGRCAPPRCQTAGASSIVTGREAHAGRTGRRASGTSDSRRWTRERFPVSELTHRWSAQDNHTPDGSRSSARCTSARSTRSWRPASAAGA